MVVMNKCDVMEKAVNKGKEEVRDEATKYVNK